MLAPSSLKSVFSEGAFLRPEKSPLAMPRMAPGKLKPTIAPFENWKLALPLSAFDELELVRSIGGELQADLGFARDPLEIRGILQERQRRNAVEIKIRADIGGVRRPVDGEHALAVALVKLERHRTSPSSLCS